MDETDNFVLLQFSIYFDIFQIKKIIFAEQYQLESK